MLGMIEVNLLPPEFRPPEKTPLPLFITVVLGITLVGAIFIYEINLKSQLTKLQEDNRALTAEKAKLDAKKGEVDGLNREIATLKARQDMIIAISQSKIMWSQKLMQLATIMGGFQEFWLSRMTLTRSQKSGTLDLAVSAGGKDLREVARFQDAIKDDPNFYYHFERLESSEVQISPAKDAVQKFKMDFNVKLPLAEASP